MSKEFQPQYGEQPLIEKREVLESQEVAVLIGYRALLLDKLSTIEQNIHLINDVLDGMGYEET